MSDIAVHCKHTKMEDVVNLVPHPQNPNKHPDKQIALLAKIIRNSGWRSPIIVSKKTGFIVSGHGRLEAAKLLNVQNVPVDVQEFASDAEEYAHLVADNRIAELSGLDDSKLTELLSGLSETELDMDLTGFDGDELAKLLEIKDVSVSNQITLQERFGVPPFSVLDARQGYWQDRKRAWSALGIQGEKGRDGEMLHAGETVNSRSGDKWEGGRSAWQNEGTSIFDPVLCELSYLWFSPQGGNVLDPFAGGSVRGIVASMLGRVYTGVDLSKEQLEANKEQAAEITPDSLPTWVQGDSKNIKTLVSGEFDLVFTCPPYADLEVYSDNPADLSTMDFPSFLEAYRSIISESTSMLKENRFAVIVVGEVRDKHGNYYNLVGETIKAFKDAGLNYYNEFILITAVGSLPIRAGKQFSSSRKAGKTHQNVLVFCKGDPVKAAKACGNIEISTELSDFAMAFDKL